MTINQVSTEENNTDSFKKEPKGIDTTIGLERANGNLDLYQDLIALFIKNHSKKWQEISDFMEKKEIEAASIRAHALKSAAGNIGAIKLFQIANALEKSLDNKELRVATGMINQLRTEHEKVIASAHQQLEMGKKRGKGAKDREGRFNREHEKRIKNDTASIETILSELMHSLWLGRIDAQNHFEKLKNAIDTSPYHVNTLILEELIEDYDFEAAQSILIDLMVAMGVEPPSLQ